MKSTPTSPTHSSKTNEPHGVPSSRHGLKSIGLLAGAVALAVLLMPILSTARESRRNSVCLSNLQQIGLGMQQYLQDHEQTLPVAYHYNNTNPNQEKGLDDTGIHHWSAVLMPYVKEQAIFVCPDDSIGGQPPTNFRVSTNNEGMGVPEGAQSGVAELQDNQVPRISYTANEQLMPRPRGGVGNVTVGQKQNLVRVSMVKSPDKTIAITEFTDHLNAVSGGGPGGIKFKSHRPTAALAMDKAGTEAYDTSDEMKPPVYAVAPEAARKIFDKQETVEFGSKKEPHIIYLNAGRHSQGNNFLFLDGHVSWMKVDDTLSCDNFLWGTHIYSRGNVPVSCAATGEPVR